MKAMCVTCHDASCCDGPRRAKRGWGCEDGAKSYADYTKFALCGGKLATSNS